MEKKNEEIIQKKRERNALERLVTSKWFLVVLLLLGFLIFIYPMVSDYYYTVKQENTVRDYENMLSKLPTEEGRKILEQAAIYNQHFAQDSSPLFTEKRLSKILEWYQSGKVPEFFSLGRLIGTVEIPKLDLKLPIRSGTTDEILETGVGYLMNTSLPIGGPSTHSVLTGHRGLPQARLFRDLDALEIGDVFLVQVLDKPHAYQVDQIKTVEPTDTRDLTVIQGKDYMTLLTCTPYTINTHRLLVRGKRIAYTPEVKRTTEQVKSDFKWQLFFKKYQEYLIAIGIFIAIMVGYSLLQKAKAKKERESHENEKMQ